MCYFNDSAPTKLYTLSLHDALPICEPVDGVDLMHHPLIGDARRVRPEQAVLEVLARIPGFIREIREKALPVGILLLDRKSTRLNSSHRCISYAVFCLKKKRSKSIPC